MPIGPYQDFAACVAANQDKDDPEAFCAYLEQQETRAVKDLLQQFAGKAQMDVDQLRETLRAAVRQALGFDGEFGPAVWVESFTTRPENKVVVGIEGETEFAFVRFPYSIAPEGGAVTVDVDAGERVLRTFEPAAAFTKQGDVTEADGRLMVRLTGAKLTADGKRRIEGYASIFGLEDRDGETMLPGAFTKGLDAFRASPAMLYNHGKDPQIGRNPIGSWLSAVEDGRGLFVKGEVAQGDEHADRVWNLIEQGHINALSVGGHLWKRGKDIFRWDLVEISVVSVPSNPFSTFEVVKDLELLPAELFAASALAERLQEKSATDPSDHLTKALDDVHAAVERAMALALAGTAVDEKYIQRELRPAMTYGHKMLEEGTTMDDATRLAIQEAVKEALGGVGASVATAIAEMRTAEKAESETAAQAVKQAEEAAAAKEAELEAARKEAVAAFQKEQRGKGFWPVSLSELPGAVSAKDADLSPARVITSWKYDRLEFADLAYLHESQKVLVPFFNPGQGYRAPETMLRAMALKTAKLWEAGKMPAEIGPTVYTRWVEDEKGLGQWSGKEVMAPWAMKADELMESDLAGFGLEWVPTLWTSQIWEKIRLENRVVSFLQEIGNVIDMPSDPYTIPLESTDPTVVKAAQATAGTDFTFPGPAGISRAATANKSLTTGKLMAVIPFTAELEEDSIIPIVPQLRRQTERSMENAVENVVINGDNTTTANSNINKIDGTPDAKDKYLVADGLRHLGLVTTTADSLDVGVLALGKIRRSRALMGLNGKLGIRPSDLMLVCDGSTYYVLLDLDEVVTADKFGPGATVRTGGMEAIDAIRIHASEEMGLANTAGKISTTAANNSKGNFVIWNRRQFRLGYRRRLQMQVERVPFADGGYLVASLRMAFQARDTEGVAVGFNIEV